MTSPRRKRAYGSARNKSVLNTRIDASSKALIDELADTRGISQGPALEALLQCVEVTSNGTIRWTDHQAQHPNNEEALPLTESA